MPSYEDDTRKVQTAVTGRPGSDQPVFLPFDHEDFDRFMWGRTREDFYCGILLGGCGKKLTAKRYLDKKCHFAHRPPVHCRRTQTGEDSADHLYIGQALQRWLRDQGHRNAEVSYPDMGSGPGRAVEVRFGPGRRLMRVQMARLPLSVWEETRAQLAGANALVHWAYGPHSGLAHNEVAAEGHAVRFSCRTEGGTRRVYVGTQRADHRVELTTLDHCRLTDDGIVTPHLADASPASATEPMSPSVAFPLLPGSVAFTASVPVDATGAAPGQLLYEADVQPVGSDVVRMRLALPQGIEPPLSHRLNVIDGSAHLIPPGTDTSAAERGWLVRAEGFSALAERTDPRWPALRPAAEPRSPRARSTEPRAYALVAQSARGTVTPQRLAEGGAFWTKRDLTRTAVISTVRASLISAARRQVRVGWHTLATAAGFSPDDLSDNARALILIEVDRPAGPTGVLLSSLVISTENTPVPYFADILQALGRPHTSRPIELGRIRKVEQARVFEAYQPSTEATGT